MRSNDVLIDVGWALERDDLESILHVDRARHGVIASAFDGKGPLRAVTKASITYDDVRCSSFEGERVLEVAAELVPYLRNAYIRTFKIDYHVLYAATVRSLLALKDYFVIDYLCLSIFDLIDGALDCRTLVWQCSDYTQEEIEPQHCRGTSDDYDEHQLKEHEERFGFLEGFFELRTVRNAENLHLEDIPYVHGKAIINWLQGEGAASHLGNAKELHVWWDSYEGSEINPLISVLEQRFRSDIESREYKFVASGGLDCTSWIQSRQLENDVGDVFEVEIMRTCSSSVTVTRYRAENAKRTSLVQNMDGPKVWDFHTTRELEKHLLGNNVYELLARSKLIANEMICKCGSRMHLQTYYLPPRFQWRCSGTCKNDYGETFHVVPEYKSWFRDLDRYVEPGTVLKRVILLARDGLSADGAAKLENYVPRYCTKLLEQYAEFLKHEDNDLKDPIERFYTAVMRQYPYDGAFRLPVLKDWEY